MKKLLTVITMLICCASFAQPNTDAVFKTIKAKGSFTLGTKKINAILNDTTLVDSAAVPTCRAVRDFVVARVVAGGSLIPNFPITISGDTISINYADRFNDGVINSAAYQKFEDDSSKFQISGTGYKTKADKPLGIGTPASSTYKLDVSGSIRASSDAYFNTMTVGKGGGNISDNTAIGYEALLGNTTGNRYVAVGYQALRNANGYQDVGIGYQAGYQLAAPTDCIIIGPFAAWYSTGSPNEVVAIGKTALGRITGSRTVGIGKHAALNATSANDGTFIGTNVAATVTTANNCIVIGSGADVPVATADDQLSIGNWIRGRGGKIGINTTDSSERFVVNGNLKLLTAGNKLVIATGSNASLGTATLSSGTITVSTTAVTSSSKIFISYSGILTNPGYITTTNIVNGTSFDIVSSSGTDGSAVNWWIIN